MAKSNIERLAMQRKAYVDGKLKKKKKKPHMKSKADYSKVISTGSTLLDLAISFKDNYEGGLPGGILFEVHGMEGLGKTTILAEIIASCLARGGEHRFEDAEARLMRAYAKQFDFDIKPGVNYFQPHTVDDLFEHIDDFKPADPSKINVMAGDSLAALTSDWELEDKDGVGGRQAKLFSKGFRKFGRTIREKNILLACSNQMRDNIKSRFGGKVVSGGNAIKFWASLRVEIEADGAKGGKIYKEKTLKSGAKVKRAIGKQIKATVVKSSVGVEAREVPVFIINNYGIDDIRGNLQWLKDVDNTKKYVVAGKKYQGMDQAIAAVEDKKLAKKLRKKVIKRWHEIEKLFTVDRKKKRF